MLTDPVVVQIAKHHSKTAAQVCLNWALQRKTIPLVKTTNMGRLTENFNCFDFELSADEVKQIDSLDANIRLFHGKRLPNFPCYHD